MSAVVTSSFKAPWILHNPHVQTCLAILTRCRVKVPTFWEELQLPDGDFVDLVWLGNQAEGPIALLIPGLEGGLHASYISSLIVPLLSQGWRVVVMHFRCCSGRLNTLPRGYSANDSDDLQMISANLRMQNPGETIIGIGFSLGASILLKMLEEVSALTFPNNYINAAVAISVPYDLARTIDYIPAFYQHYMLRSMKAKLKRKIKSGFALPLTSKQIDAIQTLREFDQKITAPLHGFASAEDYYQASSCGEHLAKINIETLLIHAWDDPLVPRSCIPQADNLGKNMRLELSEHGGHLGFLSSCLPWREQWLTRRILEFTKACL
ncbi:MAG TPA: alpha/beta fold hydrolase [Coxiellaceae bacterium]|nr:alpha/beta fold hydrolase [Coxiellaceae bacterium]